MFCQHCGAPLGENDRFCKGCGAKTALADAQNGVNPEINEDGSLKRGIELNDAFDSGAGSAPGANPYSASSHGQGGYYYAPQNSYPNQSNYAPSSDESNGMAVAGFVCAFLIPIVGLILSIIGLNKSKNLNGKGRGLAIAGIIISVVAWILNIVMIQTIFDEIMQELPGYIDSTYNFIRLFF